MKVNKVLEKSIFLFFIITSIVVFFGYATITPNEKASCILIMTTAILIFMLHGKKSLKIENNTKLLLLFDIICSISLIYTISFEFTSNQLVIIWALTIFKIVLDNIDFNLNMINKIINIVMFFGFIHVLFTLLYFLFPSFVQSICKSVLTEKGYLYNINLYKYGCIAGITSDHGSNATFISIFLSASSVKMFKKFNLNNLILFLLGFLALLLTGKRGHLIASVLAFFIIFITINKNDKKKLKNFLIGSIIVILSISILSFVPETQFVFNRFREAKTTSDLLNGRGNIYLILIRNFSNHIMLGSGLKSTLVINSFNDGHNIYLQLLSENGLIGFMITILFFIKNLIQSFKLSDSNYKYFSISYQIFFLVYGMSGNPLYYVPTLIIYFFCSLNYNLKGEIRK